MLRRMDQRTIDFYDRHAAETAVRHRLLDTTPWRARFLNAFPRGSRILDAGCGGGRDLALLLELLIRREVLCPHHIGSCVPVSRRP